MDKRIFLLAVVCSLWNISFGQNLDEILFSGDVITITGDRLKCVDPKNNIWEIDLKKDECFKLTSSNKKVVTYRFTKECVLGQTDKEWKKFYEIPHSTKAKVPCPDFWKTARLNLSKDSLPMDLFANDNRIATFRLKENAQYQRINDLDKREYTEGDAINLTKSTESEKFITIDKEIIKLKYGNGSFYSLKNNIIPEDFVNGDNPVSCEIIVSVTYINGDKKEFNKGSIVIHKKEGGWVKLVSSIKERLSFMLSIVVLIALLLIIFLGRNKIRKCWAAFTAKLSSRNQPTSFSVEQMPKESQEKIDVNTFQIEKDEPNYDGNSNDYIPVKYYRDKCNRILELEDKLREISEGQLELNTLREQIEKLKHSESAKLDEIEQLSNENAKQKEANEKLQAQLNEITIDSTSKKDLRNKIEELKGDKNKLIREKQSKERDLIEAGKTISSLENRIKEKDDKITEVNKQKDEAESNLRIEKNTTSVLQKKINSFSKQTYYLYVINDTLQAMDNSLRSLFKDVRDENLMKRLAQPVLSGTAGLDAGLESYLAEWKDAVYDSQRKFFGDDVLNMSDDLVKEKLTEFLEQLALHDSFGKLVRLYLMTNVGWINVKMVAAGFDVDAIQTLFARFKNLFNLFNIDISYPHLFVDKFDSNLHKDNMRCEIFNYFEPSEELLAQLKKRENENLIVDVTRIGIPNSKNPTRRNAMVSLPNF